MITSHIGQKQLSIKGEENGYKDRIDAAQLGDSADMKDITEVKNTTAVKSTTNVKEKSTISGRKSDMELSFKIEQPKQQAENSTNQSTPVIPQGKPSSTKSKPATKDIMSNPENAIVIQNLNFMARQDSYLNELMKEVASGGASNAKILEFQTYISKAQQMGDATGYLAKLKQKQALIERKLKLDRERKEKQKKEKVQPIKLPQMSQEELMKRAMDIKKEQELQRQEKIRLREEREQEKIRLRKEKEEKKLREREERERLKRQAREEKERERELRRQEKLAEKERIRLEREERAKEKQREKERLKLKAELKKKSNAADSSDDENTNSSDDEDDDRMGKLREDDYDEDLWNDKLSPLQERYSVGATLVFEFFENNSARFMIPRDTIFEIVNKEAEDDAGESRSNSLASVPTEQSNFIKDEPSHDQPHPKSPYVTILASFLLVHNQSEIDGWDRRQEEARRAAEEAERKRKEAEKAELEESKNCTIAENARKRRRKKSNWSTATSKRSTRLSKQAKELENLRREEENYHEEDEEDDSLEKPRPLPVYSCVTLTLSKVPFRFANFIANSGNPVSVAHESMKEIMKIGTRVPLDKLWYQVDGIKDELLAETLRYNLNRLDYLTAGGKKSKSAFIKKFGRGGR